MIPKHLVPALAHQHDAEARSRTFKPWSHVVSLIYAQLTHAVGLNDVCDALRLNAGQGGFADTNPLAVRGCGRVVWP